MLMLGGNSDNASSLRKCFGGMGRGKRYAQFRLRRGEFNRCLFAKNREGWGGGLVSEGASN